VLTGGFVHVLTDSGSTDRLSLSVLNQDTIGSARLLPGVTDAVPPCGHWMAQPI